MNGASCNTLDWLSDATTEKLGQTPDTMQYQLLPFIAWFVFANFRNSAFTFILLLYSGLANGTVVILNPLESGVVVHKILSRHTAGILHRILFSPNGEYLISVAKKVEETQVSTSRKVLCIWSTKVILTLSYYCHWHMDSFSLIVNIIDLDTSLFNMQ